LFLNSSLGQQQIKRGITGSAIPGIRTDAIKRILVPVPPTEKQRLIATEVRSIRKEARRLREEAAKEWEAAKARFEAQLLSGEVS